MNTPELLATQILHPAFAVPPPTARELFNELVGAGNFLAYVGNTPGAVRRWHTAVDRCKKAAP